MSKALSVFVPWAYRTIGRSPWHGLAESSGTISAPEAGVMFPAGSTV